MIKIQWLASIWRQNDKKCWVTSQIIQNNAKLQNRSNSYELHRLDVKTIKTKLNYKSDQNPMTCIDLPSINNVEFGLNYKSDQNPMTCIERQNDNNVDKTHQMQWIASIGCQNDQNKAKLQKWSKLQKSSKLQKWSKSNDLHRFAF